MCKKNGISDTDLGGSIQLSFMSSWSKDCEHSGSIHIFNGLIDSLLKNNLGKKNWMNDHKKQIKKVFIDQKVIQQS